MSILGRVVNTSALRVVEIVSDDVPGLLYADLYRLDCAFDPPLNSLVSADVDPYSRRVTGLRMVDRGPGLEEPVAPERYVALATVNGGDEPG